MDLNIGAIIPEYEEDRAKYSISISIILICQTLASLDWPSIFMMK
jgi:hypothetical protein